MKTINSFRSKLLALTLVLMASVSSFAHDFFVDGIYYNILDDNNVEVTYKGSSIYEVEYRNDVVIPDNVLYNGVNYVVASIGKDAFSYSNVKSVIIGNNVKIIGNNAFSNNSLLASITMGSNVQTIGNYAFYNCSYLSIVNSLPNTLINIGASAFRACSNLTTIHIPDNLTTIGEYAFYECYKLASVTLGNNVTNIEGMAFMYCKALKSITLPNITHIGSSAFNNCLSLDSVTLGNGLRNIADNLFYQCSSLTHITIPDSIECIGERAFYNCKLLKTIYIPNTVNMIGKYAFSGCSSLDSIHIPNGVTEIGERTFENCTSLQAVNLPKTISSIRYYAFVGCASLTEINIPEGVQKIESNTFQNCTSLLKITIPNSVMTIELGAFSNTGYYNDANNWEEDVLYISNCLVEAKSSLVGNYSIKPSTRIIADYALYGCSNLTSVNFAESVKSVGQASFYNCTNLSTVNMSDSLQNIGSQAFAFCEKLNPIAIPVGVKTFGTEVFQGCKSLVSVIWNAKECQDFRDPFVAPFYRISSKITSITFGDEVEYIPAGMCYGLSAVPSITIPVNVKRIGKDAFESCTSMTSITWNAKHYCDTLDYPPFEGLEYIVKSFTFGEDIETIPPYVCKEMREISEIIIPDGVISIGRHAFNYCTGIQSINIPKGVTTIGSAAFFHTQIRSVVVPEGVTEIGGWAFSECYGLNKIELPRSLKSIGNSAFKETYYIDTLICKAGVPPTMGELAVFEGVKKANISLFVPKESIELYKAADQWKEFGQILAIPTVTPEDLFPTLWGLHRTDIEVHTTQTNTSHLTCFDKYIHYVPYEKQRVYLTYDRLTYLREENNQVLLYAPSYGINEDVVLYDWTLEVGDTLPVMLYDEKTRGEMFRVVGVSLVTLLDGKEYKKWTLACGIEYIEGIGAINGDGYGNYLCLQHSSHPATYIGSPLVCASRNGKLLYQMDDAEMERLGAECLCEVETSYKSQWCNKWNVMWFDGMRFDETARTSKYRLGKDTVIGDYTYSKFISGTYVRFTDDRKVYVYHEYFDDHDPYSEDLPTGEYLAYDFSAKVGDTLEVFSGVGTYSTYPCVVDDVQIDSETNLRTMTLHKICRIDEDEYDDQEITWIEGVGSPEGFLISYLPCGWVGGGTYALLCAHKGDDLKYTGSLYERFGCDYKAGVVSDDLFPTLSGLQRTICSEYCEQADNKTRIEQFTNLTTRTETGRPYIYYSPFLLREEDNKILIYSRSLNKDLVLYDFNLQVGDSLPMLYIDTEAKDDWIADRDMDIWYVVDYHKDLEGNILPADTLIVTDVSMITLLDGKEYKKWTFNNGMEYVEGISSFGNRQWSGDFFQLIANRDVPTSLHGEHLVCVSRNGQLLYQMDDAEMERLVAECLCDYNSGPKKDNAKNGKIGGRPTPTQWNMLEVDLREMEHGNTILRAETFSYTLENDSIVTNGKTFYQLARQSTKDTATTKSFVGALHFSEDEGNRVYFLCDGEEYVLYDFTAEPGDTIEIFAGINNYPQETTYTHVVVDKDTTEDGACRMFLEVVFPDETTTATNAEKVWLAGLGSIDGIVHNAAQRTSDAHAAPAKSASSETQTSVMLCAWREDSCLYTTNHPEYDTFGCVYNQDPTALESPTSPSSYQKILREGQLLIMHDGKIYTIMGIEIK